MAIQTKPILLIEDDSNTRNLYQNILKDAGYQVTTASDGETGLKEAQKGGYSVILLDVMLPKKDGLEILSDLKQTPPKKSNGAILLLTNLSHDPILKEARDLGANSHMIKSDTTPDQLLTEIKKHLD